MFFFSQIILPTDCVQAFARLHTHYLHEFEDPCLGLEVLKIYAQVEACLLHLLLVQLLLL